MGVNPAGSGWIVLAVLPGMALLPGCMPGQMAMREAAGEPGTGVTIALTVHGDRYEIDRWYEDSAWAGKPLLVSRADLPAGCAAAQFTLDDAGLPLRVAEPVAPPRLEAAEPPKPAAGEPACTLRVSYGRFAGPPAREGLLVTGTAGVVAYAEREASQPSYYALAPAEAAAGVWMFSLGVLALPVLLPAAMVMSAEEKRERARVEAALPPEVAACWRATDALMRDGGTANPGRGYVGFVWVGTGPDAYALPRPPTPAGVAAAGDSPTQSAVTVTLRGGQVSISTPARLLGTDADIDCELEDGQVTTTTVRLRP